MTPHTEKPIDIQVNRQGDAAVMKVVGSASMAEADQLRTAIEELVSERISVVVLDLSDMDFICSLGLGAIISGHIKCRHHQGQIRLAGPTPSVRQLLETTKLTKLFGIFDTVEDALAG